MKIAHVPYKAILSGIFSFFVSLIQTFSLNRTVYCCRLCLRQCFLSCSFSRLLHNRCRGLSCLFLSLFVLCCIEEKKLNLEENSSMYSLSAFLLFFLWSFEHFSSFSFSLRVFRSSFLLADDIMLKKKTKTTFLFISRANWRVNQCFQRRLPFFFSFSSAVRYAFYSDSYSTDSGCMQSRRDELIEKCWKASTLLHVGGRAGEKFV